MVIAPTTENTIMATYSTDYDAASQSLGDESYLLNLRDFDQLRAAMSKLIEERVNIPALTVESEIALYHLGQGLFVHVYGRKGEQIRIEIARENRDLLFLHQERHLTAGSVVLNIVQWHKMMLFAPTVEELHGPEADSYPVQDEGRHLGGGIYCSTVHRMGTVHIRRWEREEPAGCLMPSDTSGIAIDCLQFVKLARLSDSVYELAALMVDLTYDDVAATPWRQMSRKRKAASPPPGQEPPCKKRRLSPPGCPYYLRSCKTSPMNEDY